MFLALYIFSNLNDLRCSNLAFRIVGNPLICGQTSKNNCSVVYPEPLSFPPDAVKGEYRLFVVCGS